LENVYRSAFIDALRLLAEAFASVREQGVSPPIIVGGAAVEYHTGGAIQSNDVDLITLHDEVVLRALEKVVSGAAGLGACGT
jgi:hypothetical protein